MSSWPAATTADCTAWNLLGVSERPCHVDPHVVNISQVTDSGTESSPVSLLTVRLPDGLSRARDSDVLVNLRPPRLVLVREPDLLRVERADQPLAFGARLVELGEEDRHVAADDD